MSYQKWSDEEDKMRNVFPDGEYRCIIDNVTEKMTAAGRVDNNGNPIPQRKMIELDLSVSDDQGRVRKLKDWVMLEGDMSWKFIHLCDACGLLDEYEAGSVEMHYLKNQKPCALVKSKKGKDKDGNEVTRNGVVDYLKPVSQDAHFDDDIKF